MTRIGKIRSSKGRTIVTGMPKSANKKAEGTISAAATRENTAKSRVSHVVKDVNNQRARLAFRQSLECIHSFLSFNPSL